MLDTYMNHINPDPFDRSFDDIIPPVGFELSLCRDYDMIVWKKAFNPKVKFTDYKEPYYEYVIVKLKIPKDAAILFTPSKCRANRAIVLGFYPCALGGEVYPLDITSAMSWYEHAYRYKLGQEIVPDYFDSDWHTTCSHGIHFFRTYEEAVEYEFN